jgi:L-ascorbate metabolism protein UlaG (beta-lactamase superfamily)
MLKTCGNTITYLGHSTFKITTPTGKVVLLDPWVEGNPACPAALKKFERLDVMLISHGHGDHMSDTVALARQFKPQIVCIYEVHLWLASKGISNTMPMSKGGTQRVGEIEVTMTQAIHSSGIEDDGKVVYAGEPAGYIVRLPGGLVLYHAGDTGLFGDMRLIGELYSPEVALLPIGDLFTMGPREAAKAVRLLEVRHVIPMHYGTFPILTGTPEALRQQTQDISGLEIYALKPGESLGQAATHAGD